MISIIIIVKNDRRIALLLEKLQTIQKPEKTEVIVVDASEGLLGDIQKQFTYSRWIKFANVHKKKTTIPDQRNVGVRSAKGDIIVFIDSDCIPDNEWLSELTKPIRSEDEHIVAGRVKLSDKNSLHEFVFTKNLQKKYVDEAPTMNIAMKREVFDTVGLFDESFQCGEDVDFCWRAIQKGYKINMNTHAIITHDLDGFKKEIKRMYTYGKARTSLYKKHIHRWKFFINESQTMAYPLFFILLPLTKYIPFYPLLLLIPILKYKNMNPIKTIILKTMYGLGMIGGFI